MPSNESDPPSSDATETPPGRADDDSLSRSGQSSPPEWLPENIAEASKNARSIYLIYLGFLAYCFVTIVGTTDRQILLDESVRLPIIGVDVSFTGFFVIAPVIAIGTFVYLQLYLQRLELLKEKLGPDYDTGRLYPWMLNVVDDANPGLVGVLQQAAVKIVLWWMLPIVLFLFAVWYLKAQDPVWGWGVVLVMPALGSTAVLYFWHKHEDVADSLLEDLQKDWGKWALGVSGGVLQLAVLLLFVLTTLVGVVPPLIGDVATINVSDQALVTERKRAQYWVNLSGKRLHGANLAEAILINADLRRAHLENASLQSIRLDSSDLRSARLNGADLSGSWLNEATLSGAQLTGANLSASRLHEADLVNTNLRNVDFGGAQIIDADLRSAQLNDADLQNARLNNSDLSEARLRGANLRKARLLHANLRRIRLEKANLFDARLDSTDLYAARLDDANLTGAHLNGAFLRSARLENGDLSGAQLVGATLQDVRLREATLRNARLDSAHLGGAHLDRATLRNVDFRDATLASAQLGDADLRRARLDNADLRRAHLVEARLGGANLRNARLDDADLQNARLNSAILDDAQFENANLESAHLSRALLSRTSPLDSTDTLHFKGARLNGATLDSLRCVRDTDPPILCTRNSETASMVTSALCTSHSLKNAILDPPIRDRVEQQCPSRLQGASP